MNGLQSILYTAAFSLCVFSAGILRGKRRTVERRIDYFTLFLVLEGLSFGLELLMGHADAPLKSLWLGLRLGFSLLIAPCLWLAVKEIVEGVRPPWSVLGRRQFWLIGAGFLMTLPLIERAHLGVTYHDPSRPISAFHSGIIHGTMLICIGIFAWQVPYYLRRCRKLLVDQAKESRADVPELRGLQFALAIVFCTWLVGLLRTLHCAVIGHRLDFGPGFALVEVGVTVAAIYAIVRRAGLPDPTDQADPEPEPVAHRQEDKAATEPKYARSALAPAMRERIKEKLERVMSDEKVYCDSLLNLRSLSAAVKEKAHYVSQVINQDFGASFYEFVNGRRIEHAKRLLLESPEETVLEIALAVGFNSKSTFNAAFRQHTGMTPTAFRSARETAEAAGKV